MSQDQRPGKMRVVGHGTPQRRRGDKVAAPVEGADIAATAGPSADLAEPIRSKANILLTLLFILGCALGGAALPLLGIL
jgi:hypothetical protein